MTTRKDAIDQAGYDYDHAIYVLGRTHREAMTFAINSYEAAVADADAPDGDGDFEEALEDFAREQAQLWGGSGNGRNLEAARARVLVLHRSAEQKGLRELRDRLARELSRSANVGSYNVGWKEGKRAVINQIDAMLKEGTNG